MVGVLAVPTEAAQQVADDLVEAGVKIIFNYSEALLAGAARGDGAHLQPCRRPALRALLLPDLMLDMARVHEAFEASTDYTVGIEEEFAILDPETLSLDQRFEELKRRRAGRSGAGRLGGRRADQVGDRDPLGQRRELRRRHRAPARGARAAVPAGRRAGRAARPPPARTPGARGRSSRSSTPSTTGAWRRGCSTSPGATTRSAYTCTWACGAPTAPCGCATACARCCPSCWRSRRTRPSSTAATRACTRRAAQIFTKSFPRCGIPDPFGGWSGLRRLRRLPGRAPARSSSRRRSGGASARTTRSAPSSCASATRRRAPRTPPRWRR